MDLPDQDAFQLVVISGPIPLGPIILKPGSTRVLGRSSSCDVPLDDPNAALSRRHLQLSQNKGDWVAVDLGSRNGTMHNNARLAADSPTVIGHGDSLRLGSWVFRVVDTARTDNDRRGQSTLVQTLNDASETAIQVERVQAEPLASLASHRLAVLLECADQIHRAKDLDTAAHIALHAMVESTGYSRAAFLAPSGKGSGSNEYETIAFESVNPLEDVSSVNFSRSLLESAARGEVVRLASSAAPGDYGQSIAELEIHSALCIPVMIDENPIGYVYLDARGSERTVRHDASSFGLAVGRLLALTATNLRSKELEIQQLAMQFDLDAAARAQRLLLPPSTGRVGQVAYSMLMRPGRMVAGDLFGVVELSDGRICAFLGDVSGKGAGAAIMMATTQSYIHAMLDQTGDLNTIVAKLNRHIADHSTGQFVTMWIGMLTPPAQASPAQIEFIDGGHGHWLITNGDAHAHRPDYRGELVLGIDPKLAPQSERFTLEPHQRLVLFSDGVVEQTSPESDEEYGLSRAAALLGRCSAHAEDVSKLLADVLEFAGSTQLRDDTTIASLMFQ